MDIWPVTAQGYRPYKNSAMQLYYWQEQKIRMGSCKVILLKRHWEIWWYHWRNAIRGWDSCWKSHPYRESSDWGLNIFPSLYILFLLDLFSGKNDFLIFDLIILPNLAENFKWLNKILNDRQSFASWNSQASFVLSNLPRASITRWLHAARLPCCTFTIT